MVQVAIKQKLDLTDAFEEAAGKGRDASVGLMAKNRFSTCLGLMSQGQSGLLSSLDSLADKNLCRCVRRLYCWWSGVYERRSHPSLPQDEVPHAVRQQGQDHGSQTGTAR